MVTVAVVSSSCSIAAGSSAAPADSCCSRSRASWSIAVVEEVDTCFFIAAVERWTAKPAICSMLEHGRVLFSHWPTILYTLVREWPTPPTKWLLARVRSTRREKVVAGKGRHQQLSPGTRVWPPSRVQEGSGQLCIMNLCYSLSSGQAQHRCVQQVRCWTMHPTHYFTLGSHAWGLWCAPRVTVFVLCVCLLPR